MKLDKNKRYLFVCQFAQSRSKYFAESLMEKGIISLYCGYDSYADIKINTNLLKSHDVIVLLDNGIKYDKIMNKIDYYCSNSDTELTEFFIDDEPMEFLKKFNELIENV